MKRKSILLASLLVAICTSTSFVNAQELYKWVDEQGVTHYADALPEAKVEHQLFRFADYQHTDNPSDDYYSIQNQLKRLQESRAEALKQKQQAAEIRAAKYPPKQEVIVTSLEPQQRYYSPAYYPYGFNKRFKYIPGSKYNSRHIAHHPKRKVNHSPVEKPSRGIVHKNPVKRSTVQFSASK